MESYWGFLDQTWIQLILPIEATEQVSIYCRKDRVKYNSHTPRYKALLEEFTLLPSHQEQQPLPTKPAQAHRGRVCHRAYHYNWKWHMQRWEVGGRKGWRRRIGREKRETEGEAGGEIHWQQWNNKGSKRVGKWGSQTKGWKTAGRRLWFSGTDTGLWM